MKIAERELRRLLAALEKHGVLLETDARLPSVSSLVAGEPIRGSWWAHARAQNIFIALNQLADHEDVLFTKLISRKVTLVHRRRWGDFISIARARETWQLKDLSSSAKFLSQVVDDLGWQRSDKLDWPKRYAATKPAQAARELEYKLLIHSEEFHTESGAHARQLESWQHWMDRVGFEEQATNISAAKQAFENLLTRLNAKFGASARLPWEHLKV